MWTISDFLGLCTLSGWNTYTGYACPTCNYDTFPCRLRCSKKWSFLGHRQFLERGHKFRLMKKHFDSTIEERGAPKLLSGSEILKQLQDINVTFESNLESNIKGKRNREEDGPKKWKKKNIFFNLPYWKDNLLRHNLDVMHIKKNNCDNVLYTLLKDDKSKDHLPACQDLKAMGIKEDLWPDENGKYLPLLCQMVTQVTYLIVLMIKTPRYLGLRVMIVTSSCKSLLPLAIHNVLPDSMTVVLVEFFSFFKELCCKRLNILDLDKLQHQILLALCHLEILLL
ncbi:hypothetical protein CR513_28700, partial [Mucuna pruriens]